MCFVDFVAVLCLMTVIMVSRYWLLPDTVTNSYKVTNPSLSYLLKVQVFFLIVFKYY